MQPPAFEDTGPGGAEVPARANRVRPLVILWPAFCAAAAMEALVFAMVDPANLHWMDNTPLAWSPSAIYSVTFLVFWCATAASAAVSQWLLALDATLMDSRR